MLFSNPKFIQNPYPYFNKLRQKNGVHYDEQSKSYLVLSAELTQQILLDGSGYSYLPPDKLAKLGKGNPFFENFLKNWFLYQDKEKHRYFRKTVGAYFTPKKLEEIKGFIREICEQNIKELPNEEFNFITKYASKIAVEVLCRMLGIKHPDRVKITNLVNVMASFIYFPKESKDVRKFSFGAQALHQYIGQIIKERNYTEEGVIHYLLELQKAGGFTEEEVVYNILLFFVAGAETPRSGITNCFYLLELDFEKKQIFIQNAKNQNSYIDELIRIEAPIAYIMRTNKEEVNLGGVVIPENSSIIILVNSANHDEVAFPNPKTINFDRPRSKFYTFGDGIHSCLGYHLAKLEIEVALDTLYQHQLDWMLEEHPTWIPRFGLRTFEQLTVRACE